MTPDCPAVFLVFRPYSLSFSLSVQSSLSVKLWACPRKKEDLDFPTRKQGRACDGSGIERMRSGGTEAVGDVGQIGKRRKLRRTAVSLR
jgi:hypothetical protein